MNIQQGNFSSITQIQSQYLRNKTLKASDNPFDFQELLKQAKGIPDGKELKFSKHAMLRMESRNIQLTQAQVGRLEDGIEKASEKGIKESLVMMDDIGFIVNVPNQTVITAVDKNDEKEKIFTNIDGAVII
jgi:flagellar operon protein